MEKFQKQVWWIWSGSLSRPSGSLIWLVAYGHLRHCHGLWAKGDRISSPLLYSGWIWYSQKAILEGCLVLQVARDLEENSLRMSGNTKIVPSGYNYIYCCLPYKIVPSGYNYIYCCLPYLESSFYLFTLLCCQFSLSSRMLLMVLGMVLE